VKGDLFCSFVIPDFCANTQQNLSKKLWLHNINSELQGALYRANIAGLHYRLYGHQCGFTIHCRGFTQALAPLAEQVLNHTFDATCSYTKYSEAKQSQHRALTNTLMNKPINRLFSRLGVLIQRYSYAPLSLLETLPKITYEDFVETTKQALTKMHCESFFHGNWQRRQAISWQETLAPISERLTLKVPITRDVIRLPKGESLIQSLHCEHEDAAVVLYLQSPDMSPEKTAFCMVIEQMLAGPFFNALRTEQQLGYVVGTGYMPHNQHPGIAFYVQSPTHGVNELFTAMIHFLKEQIHDLFFYRNYWPAIQKNLLKQLTEPDLNLVMQSQRLWLCLGVSDPQNTRQQALVRALQEMTFDDLVKGAEELLSRQSFGELILYAQGKFDDLNDDFGTKITDLDAYKAEASFFV
jgi:secreted Zn-dependent insulinase-like peptidase